MKRPQQRAGVARVFRFISLMPWVGEVQTTPTRRRAIRAAHSGSEGPGTRHAAPSSAGARARFPAGLRLWESRQSAAVDCRRHWKFVALLALALLAVVLLCVAWR